MSSKKVTPARVGASTLTILIAIFAANFMDRQIVAIFVEPIKRDLVLSDSEIGILYGFAFAVLYTTAGIPIARFADRANRARIINWSLVLFSVMTAICGLVSSYSQFLIARVGVAIGEGGTNPPSHSIISDLFPVSQRSTAMAIFSIGPHIGILWGFLIGGWVAQLWGWRLAFVIVGSVGLLLSFLSFRFLHEPERDSTVRNIRKQPSNRAVVQLLIRPASLRHIGAGAAIFSIAAYAALGWLPSFMIRSYGFSIGTAGTILALVLGLLGGCGTFFGGFIADRLGARNPKWRLRVVALALLVSALFWAAMFLTTNSVVMLILLLVPGGSIGFFLGPTFAAVQSLVDVAIRATAAAFLLLVMNVIGLGLGPIVVGALSDALMPYFGSDSLRFALLIIPLLCIWSAYHFNCAANSLGIFESSTRS